ncbi:MAG: GNAT family N-acetyltransferase [Rhodobacteraceae bacterium]|nr:GNAT family N-acetyltransferase [Paracoccaceae bacterium]
MEARINPPSSLHRLTPEAIEAFAATRYLYVIEAGSTPIACMFATDKDEFLYLGKIAVSAEYRDRGLAGVLMTQAEETARDLGFNRLRLESRIELTEVHATFASFGFTKVGETAHPGYDRPTSIIMEKVLT